MSGFSYAQAARGVAAPTSQPAAVPASNTATLEKGTDKSPAISQNGSTAASALSTTDSAKASVRALNHDATASPLKVGSEAPSSPAASSTLAGTVTESTSNFSLDDATAHVSSSDKPSRVTTPGTRSPAAEDGRKGARKSKTATRTAGDKDGEQAPQAEGAEKKEPAKIELVTAPLPSVNIWSQRMMEQAAKAKPAQPPTAAAKVAAAAAAAPAAANNSAPRSKDARKQGGSSLGGDATADAASTSSSGTTKAQARRANETARVGGSDQPRRSAPRGARGPTDKDEKPAASTRESLPPVRDADSWPTPDTAAVSRDVKAKPQAGETKTDAAVDKDAQDDSGSSKAHKKDWHPWPFVPSVSFQTPIPTTRGPKPKTGPRTNRDAASKSGGSNNNNPGNTNVIVNGTAQSSEKTPAEAASSSTEKTESEVRSTAKEANGTSLPSRPSTHAPSTHKRIAPDASHSHPREPRKPSSATLPEKPKESASEQHLAASKSDFVPKSHHHGFVNAVNGDTNGQHHQLPHVAHADRRPPLAGKNTFHFNAAGKDFSSQEHKDQHGQHTRERTTEPRGERYGRGGFRGGRGGGAGGSAQNQHMGHSAYQPNGQRVPTNGSYNSSATVLPPTAAPFNPPMQQFSYGSTHTSARLGGRNGSRGQLAAPVPYGSRLQNGVGSNARLHGHPSHSVPAGPAEFQMQPYAYSAYNPYMDGELLHGLIVQVEYYFSLDNLVKDVFLRKKMNDQGFVPLSVIAKFKRMAELAPSIDFIRAACEQSDNLDYIIDQEQNEWIRSRHIWSNFVMPPEDRDEDARKPGPDLRTVMFRSAQRPYQTYMHPMMNGAYTSIQQQAMYPQPAMYPVNGNDILYQPHDAAMHADYSPVNGPGVGGTELNGHQHRSGESQLSAAVPDFAPGGHSGAPTTLEDYQTYPDEQVEKLVVLVGSELELAAAGPDSADQAPTNGSPNGNHGSSDSGRKIGQEPYPELRLRAMQQRAKAKSGDVPATMKHLYRFWSHCLPDKFNVRMYEDFRTLALEDARRSTPNDFGLKCLLQYYNQVLFKSGNTKPYPSVFMPHHLEAKQLAETLPSNAKVNGDSRA